jgi:hypothetical protein
MEANRQGIASEAHVRCEATGWAVPSSLGVREASSNGEEERSGCDVREHTSCTYAAQARLRRTPAQVWQGLGVAPGRIDE